MERRGSLAGRGYGSQCTGHPYAVLANGMLNSGGGDKEDKQSQNTRCGTLLLLRPPANSRGRKTH